MKYKTFYPHQYQEKQDSKHKIKTLSSVPTHALMDMDVLFVGGGPAGLSGAIHLKQLCQKSFPDIQIGVLEKASRIGGHSLSGAIVDLMAFKELFPQLDLKQFPVHQKVQKEHLFYLSRNRKWPLPLPPPLRNKNFYTASLCEILRWMGEKAELAGVNIFTSFSADELLVENNTIRGVSTTPLGLNKKGSPGPSYQEPAFIRSKLTVLSDGSRGHLSQAWMRWKNIQSRYPQTYALGVKEIWEVPPQNLKGRRQSVIHTMGWPLPSSCFGGAWLYPMKNNLLSIGLVAGLDSALPDLDVQEKLQQLKTHPLLASFLKGGKCVEWGAKTIPEGGYHAMPEKLYDDGLLIAGDSAGMVNVPALKGIPYAITAGMLSAKVAFLSIQANDFSADVLKQYDEMVRKKSRIGKDLYPVRNVRQAFEKNIFWGLFKSGLMFLSQGKFPRDIKAHNLTDAKRVRVYKTKREGLRFSFIKFLWGKVNKSKENKKPTLMADPIEKSEAVYLSGNKTRDDIPSHLKVPASLPKEVQKFYTHLCPAGVYEQKEGRLVVNAPNCIDCKATDVLGPHWSPREGGAGPNYTRM